MMSTVTKRALAASFKKLLSATTMDKITIRDLVEDAGVNRQTFYYHFQDIYDLMEWIFDEDAQQVLGENINSENWQRSMERIFEYLQENRSLVLNAYHSLSRDHLERYLYDVITPIIRNILDQQTEGICVPEEDKEFVIQLYTFGLSGMLLGWVQHGMQTDPFGLMEKLSNIFSGSMPWALLRCSGYGALTDEALASVIQNSNLQ